MRISLGNYCIFGMDFTQLVEEEADETPYVGGLHHGMEIP
jgi:hypothetical protein